MSLHAYLPQDRLRAIANGASLPDRTSGTALFADITGFTALTESLRNSLGARLGAEEVSKQIGGIFSALIAEVENYGASVIDFAGDSMLCWFEKQTSGNDSAQPALTCAFEMQAAVRAFPSVGLKLVIASGDARRFVVGNQVFQKLDVLAGATVARTALGEHLANKGDILADEATISMAGIESSIKEWRIEESGGKFAVLAKNENRIFRSTPEVLPEIPEESLRGWVHNAVYERESAGQQSFRTEFRPCAALFVRFGGLDYEADDAETRLNEFIHVVQGIAGSHDGTLLQCTIGDKGSYLYINFGALGLHEDDAKRAVKSALELRNRTNLQLQMGITHGLMRVGEYGGDTRKTFGATGDDVNLAARLMTTANVDEILLSSHVHKAVMSDFTFEPRPPLPMKGKAEPLPVFAVTGESQKRAVRLQEPNYSLPMVGRQAELKLIEEKLDLAKEGKSQVIGIVAEAGLGKSRLAAEMIRLARKKGFAGYGGACQSDAVNTPYQPWKSIWGAFFDVDPSAQTNKQIRFLENQIKEIAPARSDAMPLLGVVLDTEIPDNEFTKTLEPQFRQSVLRALLQDCLRAAANEEPLLIIIEDLHWIDALSHELLEELARALPDSRICFALAYRPPQLQRLQAPRLEVMPNFTKIELRELNAAEAEQAVRAKLAQLYPARSEALPTGLVDKLMTRSQGNPFYLEELLNYVRDRGLDPANLEKIELPDSLHTLILSRIDQLSEGEKTTLRVASIIGRLFQAKWLTGYYPELGDISKVKSDLDELAEMDITPLDTPEPELAYLFKHIVTHEVTYESLPFATRAKLHEQLAVYLEGIGASVEPIAHHYGLSHNAAKQQEYWLKAGNAAYEAFANEAALDYYNRLAPLTDPQEQADLSLKRAGAYYALGKLDEARQHLHLALDGLGEPLPTGWGMAFGLFQEMARQFWHRLRYAIQPIFTEAESNEPTHSADKLKLIRAYLLLGYVDALADTANFGDLYINLRALNFTEAARRRSPELAHAYSNVAYSFSVAGQHGFARAYFRRAHAALAGLENLPIQGWVFSPANLYAIGVGDWRAGERGCLEVLAISERLGDHRNWAINKGMLGAIILNVGQFERGVKLFTELHQASVANHHLEHQLWGLAGLAAAYLYLGQDAHCITTAEKALPIVTTVTHSIMKPLVHAVLAAAYQRQGQTDQALQFAASTSDILAQTSLPYYAHVLSYGFMAEAYLAHLDKEKDKGSKAELKVLAKRAIRSLHDLVRIFPFGESVVWRWQGVYDWQNGKSGQARRAWRKSLAAAQKLGMPADEAWAYYEIGRHASGEEREANLARANEIFERLGINTNDVGA